MSQLEDDTVNAFQNRFGVIGWKHWAFFVGVPLALGTWATFENWWLLETAGLANALLFYGAHALLPWWLTCLVTALVMRLLTPWKPNQIIVMLLGVSLALFISIPYGEWLSSIFLKQTISAAHDAGATGNVIDGRFARFWSYLLQPTILWVGINLIFDRLLDFPRYRYDLPEVPPASEDSKPANPVGAAERLDSAADDTLAAPAPRFLEYLEDPPTCDDIYAVTAEQHYIKIHTPDQDYMALYRFSDAVAELGNSLGLRVHRSHWIRTSAIAEVKMDAKKMFVRLKSGREIPVSQPYQALVQQTVASLAKEPSG